MFDHEASKRLSWKRSSRSLGSKVPRTNSVWLLFGRIFRIEHVSFTDRAKWKGNRNKSSHNYTELVKKLERLFRISWNFVWIMLITYMIGWSETSRTTKISSSYYYIQLNYVSINRKSLDKTRQHIFRVSLEHREGIIY